MTTCFRCQNCEESFGLGPRVYTTQRALMDAMQHVASTGHTVRVEHTPRQGEPTSVVELRRLSVRMWET